MFYIAILIFIGTFVYIYRILSSTSGSQFEDNSIDAFIITDKESPSIDRLQAKSEYRVDYTTEGKQILILYGTEYGCSEEVAKLVYNRIKYLNTDNDNLCNFQPRLINAKDYKIVDFSREQVCFVIMSTSGDGVPPTDARAFYESIMSPNHAGLSHLKFSVLALGDSNYPQFCNAGRTVHNRLSELGSTCVVERHDVDMEDWSVINKWLDAVIEYLKTAELNSGIDYIQHGDFMEETWSRHRPFMATLLEKRRLTVCDCPDDKETIHFEFDIAGSDLIWTSGDALGIYPQNNPLEVNALLKAMHCSGTETISTPNWALDSADENTHGNRLVRDVLQQYYDLKSVKIELLKALQESIVDKLEKMHIRTLLQDGASKANQSLMEYLDGREIADVLTDFKSHTLPLKQILACIKSLQPRYYSIASSPKLDNSKVCLTISILRYNTHGQSRTGVATTYLSDRLQLGQKCPVFMSRNPDFWLPSNCKMPVILIGPGTGIAPFMAFIQERELELNRGETLLYFGCRHKEKDFLYRSQLEKWAANHVIQLSVAFSRDQDSKIYVQHLLYRDREELWNLINKCNASLYVCGDAKHMAHDVHMTLIEIAKSQGHMTENEAVTYFRHLEQEKRYQKDVWVI